MIAFLAAALAIAAQAAAPAPAPQSTATPAPAPTPAPAVVRVKLMTEAGPIVLALEKERAPVTTANFLRYVDQKRLDGTVFYRAMKLGDNYGLVQFGTRNEAKRALPPIAHEPTTLTGLSHTSGTISMAMARPGTAAGDFFIIVGDMPSMDAKDAEPGFAAFGRVVEGMDVVNRILAMPTSPTEGVGVMKGQMLSPTLRVTSARRIP